MRYETRRVAVTVFEAKLAKLFNLDDETVSLLTEALEEFVEATVLAKHEDQYYHNSRPE
jgi:hypothetical protein